MRSSSKKAHCWQRSVFEDKRTHNNGPVKQKFWLAIWKSRNIWNFIWACDKRVSLLSYQVDPNDDDTLLIPKLNICTSHYLHTWLSLIYVYKGILLLYGLFLAYETRNVAYAHLNDSRTIGVCVYNVVVLSTIGAFMGMVLDHRYFTYLYIIISVCIIFPSSATIGLIFFPKVSKI